jgi:hypothetical protein
MTIDVVFTAPPTPRPARTQNKDDFDNAIEARMDWDDTHNEELIEFVSQANSLASAMNAVAAGGAVSLQYTFSTTTTDADPGAGLLRLNNATQNAATVIRADLLGNDTSDYSGLLALVDDSTSATKGYITLRHITDSTKWLVFAVTAVASPAGYKNITVTPAASSAASPFADGDEILFDFTPNGDKGRAAGLAYTFSSTTTASDPGAGTIRFNDATLASANTLYISETDGDGSSVAAEIASWDDSTSSIKGKIKVSHRLDPTKFAIFNITGTHFDHGSWQSIFVAYVSGSGSLSNADPVTVEVSLKGDKGETGATGANGTNGVSGALVYIGVVNASGALSADIENAMTTYDRYVIMCTDVKLSGSDYLAMQMKVGGAWQTSSYAWFRDTSTSTSGGAPPSEASNNTGITTRVRLHASSLSGASDCADFDIFISNPDSTNRRKKVWVKGLCNAASIPEKIDVIALYAGDSALTGIRLFGSGTDTISGTFRLYGIANS